MIQPLRALAQPLIDTVRVMPYAELGDVHTDPIDPMPLYEQHSLLADFGPEAAERLIELVGPHAPTTLAVVEVRQLGGKVRDDRGVPSAFAFRDAEFSVFTLGVMIPEIAQSVVSDSARRAQRAGALGGRRRAAELHRHRRTGLGGARVHARRRAPAADAVARVRPGRRAARGARGPVVGGIGSGGGRRGRCGRHGERHTDLRLRR